MTVITRERPCAIVLKLLPKSTLFQNMTVMRTSAIVCVNVKKTQVWTGNTQHVDAELVMSVYEVWLSLLCWDDPDMTAVQTPSC